MEAFLLTMGVFFVGLLIVGVLFLLTLQRTLSSIHPRNRTMSPGLVWLSLIPFFQWYWGFHVVRQIADSLSFEYRDRGWSTEGQNFGQKIGMIGMSIGLTNTVIRFGAKLITVDREIVFPLLLLFNILCLVAETAFFVLYWIEIASHGRKLRADPYRDDEQADYDDNFRQGVDPSRSGRREDDWIDR